MTQKHLHISVPEPCPVPWEGMSPVDDAQRHCASCDKVIVDFSQMNDDELILYFTHNKGKLCGRFATHQLNRPLPLLPEKTRPAAWWRTMLLLPLALFSRSARAQYYEASRNPVATDTSAIVKDSSMNILPEGIAAEDPLPPGDTTAQTEAEAPVNMDNDTVPPVVSIPGNEIQPEFQTIVTVGGDITTTLGFCPLPVREVPFAPDTFVNTTMGITSCPGIPGEIPVKGPRFATTESEVPQPRKKSPVPPSSTDITGILPQQRKKPWSRG